MAQPALLMLACFTSAHLLVYAATPHLYGVDAQLAAMRLPFLSPLPLACKPPDAKRVAAAMACCIKSSQATKPFQQPGTARAQLYCTL